MRKILMLIVFALISLPACKDIIDTDPNYEKTPLNSLSPEDSLGLIAAAPLDMGTVKMRFDTSCYASIVNGTSKDIITIYSLKPLSTSGLFSYEFPKGLPFMVYPGENTAGTEKIRVTFIADAFQTGYFYDTLIINNNRKFYIPIKIKIRP